MGSIYEVWHWFIHVPFLGWALVILFGFIAVVGFSFLRFLAQSS